jgi:hypothetical protein
MRLTFLSEDTIVNIKPLPAQLGSTLSLGIPFKKANRKRAFPDKDIKAPITP